MMKDVADADKLPTGSGYNLGHQGGGGGALVFPGGRQNTLGLVISNRETKLNRRRKHFQFIKERE